MKHLAGCGETKQYDKMSKPIIKIEKLNVVYFLGRSNQARALKDISLEIYPEEFIIIFGPSGCGKSTLLYSIAGLETKVQGDIFIDNENIIKLPLDKLEILHQRKIGMIFQAYYLVNSLTVLDNIILPQMAIGASRRDRKKKALELLEFFQVKQHAFKFPNELSGGQQQRVAICRAIINDPDILLADEPIGNLDSQSAHTVMNLLKTLNEKQKKTVILVTHDPAFLNYAHRVFYMKDGAVVSVKVNHAVNQKVAALLKEKEEARVTMPKELELLARTYSTLSAAQIGSLLIPFKAREIVFDAFTGLGSQEVKSIQKRVESLLVQGVQDEREILAFLDQETRHGGGIGLDKRTALKMAGKLQEVVKEIKLLENQEKRIQHSYYQAREIDKEAEQVRCYLLDLFNVELKDLFALDRLDSIIRDRLNSRIDKNGLLKILDLPFKQGGIGLDKRIAKKMAKRLELLMLGKYQ